MLLTNATIATMNDHPGLGLIENGALHISQGEIAWVGSNDAIPESHLSDPETIDCNKKLVTPGLIDCHTHIVHAGDRAREFELRLEGASYEEIARAGGGIVSTVNALRETSLDDLVKQSLPRVQQMISEGVSTLEIKSGYGLDSENEIKMLRAARQIEEVTGIRILKTFLGAHALPPEFNNQKDQYIDLVCKEMLPRAAELGLVDAVDGFCEGIAFSVSQIEKVFDAADQLGLPIKLHAEQLSDLKGAKMAAGRGALSVDHLEYLDPRDVKDLKQSQTIAVLLPGAFYFLRETKLPPIQALREHGVPTAIATDCNPGSSPLNSLLLAMNMACTLFRLTPTEALRGTTINAAKALGIDDQCGSLEPGKSADLVIWNTRNPATLCCNIGFNPCYKNLFKGTQINDQTKSIC